MNILRNSYALGFLMVVAELIINNVLLAAQLPHISGIIFAAIVGSVYAAQHKERMPFKERLKTLAVYLLIAGVAGFFIALTVDASMPELAIAIMLGTLFLYAIFMYFMLGLGSSVYMSAYEKKQAANSAQPGSVQNPLQPIPNAKEFQNKHPKLAITLGLIGCTALFIGLIFIAADPLFEASVRFFMGGLAALMALMIIGALWRVLGKKIWVAAVSAIVLTLVVLGVYMHIANLPAPAIAGVDKMMIGYQEVALRCAEKGADLRGKLSGWNRGVPQVESAICSQESSWKMLPPGWKYLRIVDADVSDGTFTFGAHSRAGDYILCGEKWCALRDAQASTTILSLTPPASSPVQVAITSPESRNVRPGERIEVAQITLTNSSDKSVDLRAFWYKKSGTASNNAIDTVFIIEGDRTHGMNYMHYLGRSTDDRVYFDQPNMFAIEPEQSRTYSVQIELGDNIPLEIGKTVGLDFVGFSYDQPLPGMPVSGVVHTITR